MNLNSSDQTTDRLRRSRYSNRFGNYNLRTRIIAAFVFLAVVCTAGVGFTINRILQVNLSQQAGAHLYSLAQAQALIVGNNLSKQIELLKTLGLNKNIVKTLEEVNAGYSGDPAAIQADVAKRDQQWLAAIAANNDADPLVQTVLNNSLSGEFKAFQLENPDHIELFLTDKYGAIVTATGRISGFAQAQDSWWQAAYNSGHGNIYFGQSEYDESSSTYVFPIAIPIIANNNGEVLGVLRTNYRLIGISQSLTNVRFGQTGNVSLVFPDGGILESSGTGTEKSFSLGSIDPAILGEIKANTQEFEQRIFRGKERIISITPVDSNSQNELVIRKLGWTLIAAEDPSEALAILTIAAQSTVYISLGALLLASILAAFGAQYLSGPITRLTVAVEKVRSGDLDFRVKLESNDEIGELADSFNTLTDQLQETLQGLEQRVADRTADLEERSKELADRSSQLEFANTYSQKRAAQFQAISDVARATTSIRQLTDLLPRITKVVSEQFGFSHTGIFLLDEAKQYAVLSAANSEGGQRMLTRRHRLKVGAEGIVGYVTAAGNPRIALDTGADVTFFNNPDLPETRSEMAVPLKSGLEVIGALDVQSNQSNAFSQEDIDVIQILADLISIAIDNARQFEKTQKSLSEVETIYRQYLRREWDRLSSGQEIIGYRYSVSGVTPLEARMQNEELMQAAATGEITTEFGEEAVMAVPIKLRNEVIGVLNISTQGKRTWKNEEINLVQSVADRIAISAENARLFEDATGRAERERTVSIITSKIRGTNNPNEMIQIALNELRQALQVKDARIVPYNPPQSLPES